MGLAAGGLHLLHHGGDSQPAHQRRSDGDADKEKAAVGTANVVGFAVDIVGVAVAFRCREIVGKAAGPVVLAKILEEAIGHLLVAVVGEHIIALTVGDQRVVTILHREQEHDAAVFRTGAKAALVVELGGVGVSVAFAVHRRHGDNVHRQSVVVLNGLGLGAKLARLLCRKQPGAILHQRLRRKGRQCRHQRTEQ